MRNTRRPPQALAPAPSPRAVPFPSGEGARGGRGPQPRACGAAGACPPPPPGGAPACNSARCPLSSARARPPAARLPLQQGLSGTSPWSPWAASRLGPRTVSRRTPSTLPTPGGGSGSSRKRSCHCPSTCPLLTRGPRAVAPGLGRVHRVLCDSGGGLRAPDATCSALPRARRPDARLPPRPVVTVFVAGSHLKWSVSVFYILKTLGERLLPVRALLIF